MSDSTIKTPEKANHDVAPLDEAEVRDRVAAVGLEGMVHRRHAPGTLGRLVALALAGDAASRPKPCIDTSRSFRAIRKTVGRLKK